ncbi:MAG: hypothetical protein HOO96_32300 [Polyangiaceae bacterium]|nr:hypothetical protein [Polyangiaceae bacterium]
MGKMNHFAVVLVATMLAGRNAAAGEGEEKAAALLYEAGLEKMETRDFARAAELFAKARANAPSDLRYLLQLSVAELRSNRPLDALAHLREYQADPRAAVADREKAKAYIEEAYARTGHLKVEGPPGAEVLVDAKPKGACPITAEIDVEADQALDVQIKVENKSQHASVKCPAGKVVTVRVEGEGNATVRIGKHTPNGPPTDDGKSGGWPGAKVAVVIGLGVVGAGGLATSAILIPVAKGKEDAARDATKSAADRADARSSNDSLRTMSTVFFYGGAAFALGTVAAAIFWPNKHATEKPETSDKTAIHPLIGPGVFGAEGTF